MKPIEKMAAAYISAGISQKYWDELSPQNQLAIAACMRAALMALAEADLDEPMINAGWEHDNGTVNFEDDFRILLKVIANEANAG
jgi:hypothetical protein